MSPSRADGALHHAARALALLAGAVMLLITAFLLWESLALFGHVSPVRLFADAGWNPTEGRFNMTAMIAGTLICTAGAVAVAAPIGIASSLFCHFYAPRPLAALHRRAVELMAGVPSVVWGLWGLLVLVPLLAKIQPPGSSVLAGVLILALMTLPTVALLSDAAIGEVPGDYHRAGAALALSRWGYIRRVVLPVAAPGILTGVVLQTGRALGETMAVLMVTGNVVQIPGDPFEPARTLTANIALEMAYATGDHRAALFASGLLLTAVVAALVLLAERFRVGRRAG